MNEEEDSKLDPIEETITGGVSVADKNIYTEYYPLLHNEEDGGYGIMSGHSSSSMYSAQVVASYKDAMLSFLVTLASMVILSITALVFCKFWGLDQSSIVVTIAQFFWLASPFAASIALRKGQSPHINARLVLIYL